MIVKLGQTLPGPEPLGIPMLFPMTWEENTAANMTQIPFWELFPGLMVKDLYKAYRFGLDSGKIEPDSSEKTISYLANITGKSALLISDFIAAMIKTVAQGKAPASILEGKALTGIEEKIPAATSAAASSVAKSATFGLSSIAIIAAAGLVLYAMGTGILPKPKYGE
jgi:hypothetical protein